LSQPVDPFAHVTQKNNSLEKDIIQDNLSEGRKRERQTMA